MTRQQAEDLVATALALAMSRDGSSGGVIRCAAAAALWLLLPYAASRFCSAFGGTDLRHGRPVFAPMAAVCSPPHAAPTYLQLMLRLLFSNRLVTISKEGAERRLITPEQHPVRAGARVRADRGHLQLSGWKQLLGGGVQVLSLLLPRWPAHSTPAP